MVLALLHKISTRPPHVDTHSSSSEWRIVFGLVQADEEEGLPVDRPGGLVRSAKVQAELKFTYVVSCQSYGEHKNSPLYQDKVADIAYLMRK
jgi:hypothetical protein